MLARHGLLTWHRLGHGQKLHHIAKLLGVGDVAGIELVDPLCWDGLAGHRTAVGQARQNCDLVGGISPLHISSGVGFGVAQPLGVGQHVWVGGPLSRHAAEDVVGGAVDDAAHPLDPVGSQGLLQGLDDRDAATYGGFDQHVDPTAGGGGGDLLAITRNHGLVGGYYRFASCNRPQDQGAGRLQATHHLHHDVDRRVVDHGFWVGA